MTQAGPTKKRGRTGAGLSRERIAEAALALLDAEGEGALTARRLAAELGCEAMSLYHHVAGMEEVRDLVVDRVLGALDLPREGGADWRGQARRFARGYLGLARAHPRAIPLVAGRRWRTPAALRLAASALELFGRAGFPARAALRAARILGAYLNGAALASAAWQLAVEPAGAAPTHEVPPLPLPRSGVGAGAVRADLEAGIDRLIAALAGELDGVSRL